MVPVFIDISNFATQSSFTEQEIKNFSGMLLDRLALKFEDEWQGQIKENLHSTRAEYQRGIYIERPNENTIVFGVTARQSRLAVDLEMGKGAFDEKIGFANSSKKRPTKSGGWVLRIPFRYSTPGTVGESEAFAGTMPEEVYNIAKSQSSPIQLNQLSPALQRKGVRPELKMGNKVVPAYKHKSAKFEGMVRNVDQRENRGTYNTFRTVSDKSDKNSWIHKGLQAYNLLGKALAKTDVTGTVRRVKIDFFKNR